MGRAFTLYTVDSDLIHIWHFQPVKSDPSVIEPRVIPEYNQLWPTKQKIIK